MHESTHIHTYTHTHIRTHTMIISIDISEQNLTHMLSCRVFGTWDWLHYVQESDSVYCYIFTHTRGMLTNTCKQDAVFVPTGFTNWNPASDNFNNHGRNEIHKKKYAKTVCNCNHKGQYILCSVNGVIKNSLLLT